MEIAKRVLELQADPCAVFQLVADSSQPHVSPDSPLPTVRGLYMKLAALVHPDKLAGWSSATEAFQVVVRCFDAFANGQVRASTRKQRKPPSQPPKKQRRAEPKRAAETAVRRRKRAASSSSSSSSTYSTTTDDSDDSDSASPNIIPNYAPSEPRSNEGCVMTPMSCPNCRTLWHPDTPNWYTLVMAYGVKVHCATCLLQYGWATALHGCPYCHRSVGYEPEKYNTHVTCTHCKKRYGYVHYPISDRTVTEIAQKLEAEEREIAARKEREERMARRGGNGDDLDLIVGQCIVEDQCPHCRKRVDAKHRAHVVRCLATQPEKAARVRRSSVEGEKRTAPRKRSLLASSVKPKKEPTPAAGQRRRS